MQGLLLFENFDTWRFASRGLCKSYNRMHPILSLPSNETWKTTTTTWHAVAIIPRIIVTVTTIPKRALQSWWEKLSVAHHPVEQTTWGNVAMTKIRIHFGLVGASNTSRNGASDKSQNATINQLTQTYAIICKLTYTTIVEWWVFATSCQCQVSYISIQSARIPSPQ
jgi:hypothetical protein